MNAPVDFTALTYILNHDLQTPICCNECPFASNPVQDPEDEPGAQLFDCSLLNLEKVRGNETVCAGEHWCDKIRAELKDAGVELEQTMIIGHIKLPGKKKRK